MAAATPHYVTWLPPEDRAAILDAATRYGEQVVARYDELRRSVPPAGRERLDQIAAQDGAGGVHLFHQLWSASFPPSPELALRLPPQEVQALAEDAFQTTSAMYDALADPPELPAEVASLYAGNPVLARARAQLTAVLDVAPALSERQLQLCLGHVLEGIDGTGARLQHSVATELGERFPSIQEVYRQQIGALMEDVGEQIVAVGEVAAPGDSTLAAAGLAALDQAALRLGATFEDVEALATFGSSQEALETLGIELVQGAGSSAEWSEALQEHVVAQALRIENAFRRADSAGLLSDLPPGEAFQQLFANGDILTLRTANPDPEGDGERLVGAITRGSRRIDFWSFSSAERWDGAANSLQYHLAHELGHAFNATMVNAYSAAGLEGESPYVQLDDPAAGLPDSDQRQWNDPAWGLPASWDEAARTWRRFPHQQNTTASEGEYFADSFSNWANGTLLVNDAGRGLQAWMDERVPEWIRLRLEANEAASE